MIDPYVLILDRWVFRRYAMDINNHEEDDPENARKCEEILLKVRKDGHTVAIDDNYEIPTTEWDEFRNIPLLREWIKYILNGRVEYIPRTEVNEPIDDPDDQHYIEIALDSQANIMISGDKPLKEDINSRNDIDLGIWDQDEGCGLLRWFRDQGYADV